ncbi:hypothetical protein HYPSUDRAFT_206035 [Hypholoma sublateritium FD-334 SS-4]|uniref:Uncharacterized protein n=1 Tax=Hypholoma sublateritium (strain FD-334 SS-4) TaxID=945553 RepID=A0A0D2PB65_HYPSF|nr:hypothetical protein HYPSUDRAFT_206035 [Hypholoma sublateritium FD-334 SS-4]
MFRWRDGGTMWKDRVRGVYGGQIRERTGVVDAASLMEHATPTVNPPLASKVAATPPSISNVGPILRILIGCHFAEIIKGDGFFVVSGLDCPTHSGSGHVVPGCPLHHYFPRDDEIISVDRRVLRQVPSNSYVEVSSLEESPTAAPLIPSAPNTPEPTPTRPKSPFSWGARRESRSSNTSSEAPPEKDTFYIFSQSPPPTPTESQIGWPNRPNARENSSPTFDDMDIDIEDIDGFNPEDYADFDHDRPALWVPAWFKPSDDLQPTHWYDVAAARDAEAWAAVELDAALERVTETAAILSTARATAEEADIHVRNATLQITASERSMRSPEYLSTLHAALDVATDQARDAAEVVAVAAAEATRARAAARIAGASIDDDSDEETDDTFDNGLPWSSGGSWSIVNELDTLGETQDDYEEH